VSDFSADITHLILTESIGGGQLPVAICLPFLSLSNLQLGLIELVSGNPSRDYTTPSLDAD
jgi:hypothetical protein